MTCFLPIKQQTQSASASHVSLGPTTSSQKPSKKALVSSRSRRRRADGQPRLHVTPTAAASVCHTMGLCPVCSKDTEAGRLADHQSINQSPLKPRALRTARRSLKANSSLQTHIPLRLLHSGSGEYELYLVTAVCNSCGSA
jgi:hypothetical protein